MTNSLQKSKEMGFLQSSSVGEVVDPKHPRTSKEVWEFIHELELLRLPDHGGCSGGEATIYGKGYQERLGDPYIVKASCNNCGKVYIATAPLVSWQPYTSQT